MSRLASILRGAARGRRVAAGLLALAASASFAAPSDVAAGARIAASGTSAGTPACASCHGSQGQGGGTFPHLAGTGAGYLREQLDAFAAGTRKSAFMQTIAQGLSAEQRAQVAAFYASLAASTHAADRSAQQPSDAGAWLATRGRWAEELPACAQCHGPGGVGVGTAFPPLAGQPAAYLAQQLKAFQDGTRPAGPLGLMQGIARKLGEAEVQAVSNYYAGLGTASAATQGAK
jgi:cytochrome c553